VEDRQGNPEDEQGKASDETAEGVGEDHAPAGACALRGTGESLVQHLVQTVEHASDPDYDIAQKPVLRFLLCFAHCAVRSLFAFAAIPVRNHQNSYNGNDNRKHLIKPQLIFQ
jgi:hypothetical protein